MVERTVEDRLREEYFDLLPDIRRVAEHLEAEVKYCMLPISRNLNRYEKIVVTSRIKECDSALDALRRRQEGATFDRDRDPQFYTLTSLNDLAGVRVLVFPRSRLIEVDQALVKRFSYWRADPVIGYVKTGEPLALKYYGYCEASNRIRGELQVVSMLIGLFWEVEHSVIYKPTLELKGAARNLEMKGRIQNILKEFKAFEDEFENQIQQVYKE